MGRAIPDVSGNVAMLARADSPEAIQLSRTSSPESSSCDGHTGMSFGRTVLRRIARRDRRWLGRSAENSASLIQVHVPPYMKNVSTHSGVAWTWR